MRYLVVLAILICSAPGLVVGAAAAEKESAATQVYNHQISAIASKAIDAEVSKHPERMIGKVSMKLKYSVAKSGRVQNVKVISGKPDGWAEKTAARALQAVKFPPVPDAVLQELGTDHLQAVAELSYETTRKKPVWEEPNSAYYKYNMRVHKLLQDKVKPLFTGQPAQLEVDYEFYLDAQGRLTGQKSHAKKGGKWAEQTVANSIRSLKCPPIPPQVFKELEENPPLKIYGTMTWDPYGGR
jgi:hypothetical protein